MRIATLSCRHKNFNSKYNYKHVDNLPYLYGVPKMHKNPKSLIAGVANFEVPIVYNHDSWLQKAFYNKRSTPICSTTSASKKLSLALQDVMTLLQEKDDNFFKRRRRRRCRFIRSAEEVFFDIKQNLVLYQGKEPRTYDFTTMYTFHRHVKILRNMRTSISAARAYQQKLPV